MKIEKDSSGNEDGHQAIYFSLHQLPDPLQDLPKPWNFRIWRSWFVFSFFICLFSLWSLGKISEIDYLSVGGSCVVSWGIYLFLGIFLIMWFHNRGIRESYSSSANPALAHSLKKYRKKRPREAYFELFVKYIDDNQKYFLVWYVTGSGSTLTRSLAEGAEPLLFNNDGKPIDDLELFSKVILMWTYGLNISPGTMQYKLIKDRNHLRKLGIQHLPPLPDFLEKNSAMIDNIGLNQEFQLVKTRFSAKYALFLHSIDILDKKISWADSHGWDSITQLRYKDFEIYHAANVNVVQSREHLMNEYQLADSETAAIKIIEGIQSNPRQWLNKRQLIKSLEVFSVQLPAGEIQMKQDLDGNWKPQIKYWQRTEQEWSM